MTPADLIAAARAAGVAIESEYRMGGLSDPGDLYMNFAEDVALRVATVALAAERAAIIDLLAGIDQTETDNPAGWWPTSTGAAFGAGLLAQIRARGSL